ncbi:MAG: hypothetical protein J07HN4v3_02815 [Halonotius sp. J07HN4]|nr:MAG: hypothetical protein J07HN4v3_02815 [Halonotius sp. J07HN4]
MFVSTIGVNTCCIIIDAEYVHFLYSTSSQKQSGSVGFVGEHCVYLPTTSDIDHGT